MDKQQILEKVKEKNIQFVHLQFVDILGIPKAVTIPVDKLDDAIDNHVWFDGSSIEGFARICESDMFLKLDLNTFSVIPWESSGKYSVARIICDVFMPDGSSFLGDPRGTLKRMLKKAEQAGFTYNTGPELEFFLFEDSPDNEVPALHDKAGYFDLTLDKAHFVRQEITLALQEMGIDVETLHHEVAESQHEICFKYDNALTTADNATTLKFVVKEISKRHGLKATFMPKPFHGINGNGMHVHQSLFTGSQNVFFAYDDKYFLSDIAKQFIAGQLQYIKQFCAVTNPTVNSYKRLVPGYEAPVYKCWAAQNRSALIRIPSYTKGKEQAVRCELRCPDPSSNVYLAFSLMLAAGLRGIEQRLEVPNPVEENLYAFGKEDLKNNNIEFLPGSLGEAIVLFKNSSFCRDVLGEFVFESYTRAKEEEWKDYCMHVSQWERDRYLAIY